MSVYSMSVGSLCIYSDAMPTQKWEAREGVGNPLPLLSTLAP